MLTSKNAIYLDIQKTGSTFTEAVLQNICNKVYIQKHVPNKILKPDKLYFTNIRNPWDYHVSVWTFDVRHNGPLIKRIKHCELDAKKAKTDFNYFIECLYNELNYYDFEDWNPDLQHSLWKNFEGFGLQSFRTCLFFDSSRAIIERDNKESKDYFKQIYDKPNTHFIEQMDLANQLKSLIEQQISHFGVKENYQEILNDFINKHGGQKWRDKRSFKVSRPDHNYQKYYNDNSQQLIYEKESVIIETFNYKF